MVLTSLKAL